MAQKANMEKQLPKQLNMSPIVLTRKANQCRGLHIGKIQQKTGAKAGEELLADLVPNAAR